jgi:hypothetical protein
MTDFNILKPSNLIVLKDGTVIDPSKIIMISPIKFGQHSNEFKIIVEGGVIDIVEVLSIDLKTYRDDLIRYWVNFLYPIYEKGGGINV